jgi:flap endonuclease-1
MGLNIGSLVGNIKRAITIENLSGRKLSIDAFNVIYQFLYNIRGMDGKPLQNYNKEITSHLYGIFYRNINFMENNIIPIYCFDGKDKRKKLRWTGNPKSSSNVRLTDSMVDSCKELLDYMGINWVQSVSEGEAQCVYLTQQNHTWSTVSQDYDTLVYGGERLIRNLTINRKKKKKDTIITLDIEYVSLVKFLEYHKMTKEMLVDLSILIGNDYFPGIRLIGQMNGLKLMAIHKDIKNIPELKNGKIILKNKHEITRDEFLVEVNELRNLFLCPKVNKDYKIYKKKKIDYDKIKELLVEQNNFSVKRISNGLERIRKVNTSSKQIVLDKFFK